MVGKSDTPDLSYIIEDLWPLAVPIETVCEDPHNARVHSDVNLRQIAESYRTFKQRKPIVVRESGVSEAGSGQLIAARDILGWKYIAVVHVDDNDEMAMAYAIADNKSGESSDWDDEVLLQQLAELDGDMLAATGFEDEEIADLEAFTDFWGDGEKSAQPKEIGIGANQKISNVVKVAIDVENLEIVERALRATGEHHRGRALAVVCEAYLHGQETAEVQ